MMGAESPADGGPSVFRPLPSDNRAKPPYTHNIPLHKSEGTDPPAKLTNKPPKTPSFPAENYILYPSIKGQRRLFLDDSTHLQTPDRAYRFKTLWSMD